MTFKNFSVIVMTKMFNRNETLVKKIISAAEAGKLIRANSSLMIGGFLRCGTPQRVIEEIIKNRTDGLTLIANDTSYPEYDRGRLIVNKLVRKAIVTHIGTNPETGRRRVGSRTGADGNAG